MHQADSMSPPEGLQGQRSAQTKFRPDIEGLRAIAVLAVVLFHAEVPGLGGGYVGVDVFFVISGFLITGLLWREAHSTGTVRLRGFYGARARRLLPASAFVGVVTMIASALVLPPLQVPAVMYDGIASALYVSNFWFIGQQVDYFTASMSASPFLHYWSLGVEEQFYLVWPALILATAWLIRKVRRRTRTEATTSQRPYLVMLVLVAVVSLALSLAITYIVPFVAFFSLPTRAWQLALGGLVALTAHKWHDLTPRTAAIIGWAGLAMILVACTWLTEETLYPGFAALLPTLGAVLVIVAGCATPAQGCGRLLGVPPMRAIGRISYSWYLWHWPILILVPAALGHAMGLPARLLAALVSAGLAFLTLRLLENPLRFATPIRTSAWRSLGLGAVATAIAVCVGVTVLKVMPPPVGLGTPAKPLTITAQPVPAGSGIGAYDAAVRQLFTQVGAGVAASVDLGAVPSNLTPALADAPGEFTALFRDGCLRNLFDSGVPECASGDTSSKTTVALIGDSEATMWRSAFEQVAEQRHWRLETMGRGGCTPLDLHITDAVAKLLSAAMCTQWREQVITRLRAEHPRLVVVSMLRAYGIGRGYSPGFSSYDPAWLDALTRLTRELRDIGATVLVLGPVPSPLTNVPICLSGHLDNASACAPTRSAAVNQSGIDAEANATRAAGGHYADLNDLFCTTDRCPVIVGNSLVYFDAIHLTTEHSLLLAPVMGALADRALAQG